jgi:hypothetical protein
VSSADEEALRVLEVLGADQGLATLEQLPPEPGIYTVWPRSTGALDDLGLDDVEGEEPLASRALYLGKAQDSIRARVAEKHFVSGDTGHSTLRRSLAALLGLRPAVRRTRIEAPTRKQLMTLTASYDLVPADDDRLTLWMAENLELRMCVSEYKPLREVERHLGAEIKPPLDQEPNPLWGPNPWRGDVKEARRAMTVRLRQELGLE